MLLPAVSVAWLHDNAVTEAVRPYSQRDPYWGVDDYGRPLSYGQRSFYGPLEPVDPAHLAEQLTYRQAHPDQLPIDPAALQAPSVFAPLWPVSVQPAVNRSLTEDGQTTEWVGIEQETTRFVPPARAASELVHTPPVWCSAVPTIAVQSELARTVPQRYLAFTESEFTAPPTSPPYVRLPAARRRGGRLIVVVAVVLALLVVGTMYHLIGSKDSSRASASSSGAFEQVWQAPDSRLTLDIVAVNDTIVSVECQPASQNVAISAQRSRQGQGPIVRTREKPKSCSLIGRGQRDGESRWKLDRQSIGVALASTGPAVIAYGGDQALVVSAVTGEITRTFADGVLLGYAGTTAIFAERPTEAVSQVIAIDVTDGRKLWQVPIAQSPAVENARAVSQASIGVPSGFDRMYYDGMAGGNRYVMVPDATTAGEYKIRDIATGGLAQPRLAGRIFGVASGYALHVTGAGDKRVLHGTRLGADDAAQPWNYELPPGGYVAACAGLVCVQDVSSHRSAVVDPVSGEPIYRNDSGWSYVRRGGDLAVIVRCSAAQDVRVCPGQDAGVEVVRIRDRARVWSGKRPAFVAPQGRDAGASLMVGVAEGNRVRVLAFSDDSSNPTTVGTVALKALESVERATGQPAVGNQRESATLIAVPNVSCVATDSTLSCGSRWSPMRATTWNVT